jgi:hypothetical protein
MTTVTFTEQDFEGDRLMAMVERMQQAGHSERQISRAIGESLRGQGTPWSARVRAFVARVRG